MQKQFFDQQQAYNYLNSSVVQYQNEPVYVISVDNSNSGLVALIRFLRTNGETHVPITDLDLNLPPLGMINYDNRCCYMARVPVRMWRIGYHPRNIKSFSLDRFMNWRVSPVSQLMLSRPFYKMLINDYPNLRQAKLRSMDYQYPVAFCRDTAIYDKKIYYKNRGHVANYDKELDIKSSFSYLEKVLNMRIPEDDNKTTDNS